MKRPAFTYGNFRFYRGVAACLALSLGGCAGNNISDLQDRVDEVKKRQVIATFKLPDFPPEIVYLYPHNAQTARNPFERFDEKPAETTTVVSPKDDPRCRPPDINRNRESLESYPLDALKMVGTLYVDNIMWGLVQDPEGLIHQVQVNNYAGQNNGKIIHIGEDIIEFREIADDGTGCFQERDATLKISAEDQKT